MNDHNLDDLIIDNIKPKNAKNKSLLTIIALAIVVLIVAIILTKTLLKDPNDALAIGEDNTTELISPELTLQNTINKKDDLYLKSSDNNVESKPVLSLEDEAADEKSSLEKLAEIDTPIKAETTKEVKVKTETIKPKSEDTKPKTVTISQDIFEDESDVNAEKQKVEKEKVKKAAEAKKLALANEKKKKLAAQKKAKAKALASKIKVTEKTRNTTKAKNTSSVSQKNGHYYIQVGSFKQSPSKQFLSIIKKSGFHYRITSPSSSGTKKLLIGPYSNRASANSSLQRVKDRINKGAFIVTK